MDTFQSEGINDVSNIVGFDKIVNKEEINPEIDIEAIKNEEINSGNNYVSQNNDEGESEFKTIMETLKEEVGDDEEEIDILDGEENYSEEEDNNDFNNYEDATRPINLNAGNFRNNISDLPRDLKLTEDKFKKSEPSSNVFFDKEDFQDQNIDRIIGGQNYQSKELNFDVKRERLNELKEDMYDDIQNLQTELTEMGVDISRVPQVTMSSSFEDIKAARRMYRSKYNSQRYHELGRDAIIFGIQMFEKLFDGKRDWFGYRPNLTGFNKKARVKLGRMRYETQSIVRSIFDKYELSPMSQMAFELVPSAFLYANTRHDNSQKEQDAYENLDL